MCKTPSGSKDPENNGPISLDGTSRVGGRITEVEDVTRLGVSEG